MALFRPVLDTLVPYEPGKPVEEVQRELGIERVVKLASNEGPWGPFPAALEALERAARELNRYPDGGAYRLRAALADRHGVAAEEVTVGAGADAVIDCLSQAVLEPGDEIATCWPSFPSYPIYGRKLDCVPRFAALRDHRFDLDALRAEIGPRTKLVYVCSPNNPTGTMTTRAELTAFLDAVPEHVLVVLDQAYFEWVDDPEHPDGIADHFRAGRRVVVLRTFSKMYGLASMRVGYAVAPPDVVTAIGKTRRAFEVSQAAQEMALASLGEGSEAEVERRRRVNGERRRELEALLRERGFQVAVPAVANFLYADGGTDAAALYEALLREGVIVRPLTSFGAPTAIRVTVGTAEEHAFLAEALDRVLAAANLRNSP